MKIKGVVLALAVVALTATAAQADTVDLRTCNDANNHCGHGSWIEDGGRQAIHTNGNLGANVFAWAECWFTFSRDRMQGRLMVDGKVSKIDIDYIKLIQQMPDGTDRVRETVIPGIKSLSGTYGIQVAHDQMWTTDIYEIFPGVDPKLHVEVKYSLRWNNTFEFVGPYRFSSVRANVC